MLTATSLSKRYGAFCALDGVSVRVDTGEIVGLLGRNGAGKSTLMNLLTGYIGPTEGEVRLDGVDIAENPAWVKARIGYLPEVPPLYADMTVREALSFAAEIKRIPAPRRSGEIDAALERVEAADHRKRLVRHLSKGYRQRVGLAQALLGSPDVLILDEPSAGLDPTQIAQMREVIRTYARGHAVMVSSHILGEVEDLCNFLIVLDQGRVVKQDRLERLTADGSGALLLRYPESDGMAGAVAALPQVKAVSPMPPKEPGCEDLCVEPAAGQDARAAVFALFSARGVPLLMMKPVETALEDVFRELTTRTESGAQA